MARARPRPLPIRPPSRPGHPPLTTPSGRIVIYVVCTAGGGRQSVGLSSYFSAAPGFTKAQLDAAVSAWLSRKLQDGGSDVNRFPRPSDWSCSVKGSLGVLPQGSNAIDLS